MGGCEAVRQAEEGVETGTFVGGRSFESIKCQKRGKDTITWFSHHRSWNRLNTLTCLIYGHSDSSITVQCHSLDSDKATSIHTQPTLTHIHIKLKITRTVKSEGGVSK